MSKNSNGNRAPCVSGAALLIASVVFLLLLVLLVDELKLLVGRRNDGSCLTAVLFLSGRLVNYGVYVARAPCRSNPPQLAAPGYRLPNPCLLPRHVVP